MTTVHKPVLLQKVLEGLNLKRGMTVVDGTVNAAGHARPIAERIGAKGTLIGIDADREAIKRAQAALADVKCRVELFHGNFRRLSQYLERAKVAEARLPTTKRSAGGQVDAFLFDLGLSSDQLETSRRGFSFQNDEPLSMAFGADSLLTAEEIVNTWDEENIADVIWGYGGEQFARRIARAIVGARLHKHIARTGELVQIITEAVPRIALRKKIHPATKTFQALRIAVNDELGALREVLPQAWDALRPGGRIAIISFHSLEDRIVKSFFKDKEDAIKVTKKPIVPTEEEVQENPRSRSAKVRIIEKV